MPQSYKRRVPTSLFESLSLFPGRIALSADIFYEGRPQAVFQLSKFGVLSWDIDRAIAMQNRSVYMYIRRRLVTFSSEHILAHLMLYGMYAWITEPYDDTGGSLFKDLDPYQKSDLLADALHIQDPVIIELLLREGARITHDIIINAMDYNHERMNVSYPWQPVDFKSRAEEREHMIKVQQEIIDLLIPFSTKYGIHPQYLTINMNPDTLGKYND